ncbi:hypothetical protein [Halorubrum sp. Atlit-28R]|uniref:hypothetical protein n=1 Tax=Halorubrum sp. Atlit-28R TaxID=2282129 RepID=UPI000EF1E3D9|nr:hypothetical protein [Halorubrum sp. Atlit-28R]RLM49670.1 hypothetical protein DVK06_14075 [Halorubrum sp. Atlit-28R]
MSDQQQQSEKYEETEARRDVHIEKEKRSLYTDLRTKETSPFYEVDLHDLFTFAMAYGRRKAGSVELDGKEHALFGRSSLREEQEGVIEAIAVREERSLDVLRDERFVYEIAEEYANGGIEKLHGRVFGPEDDALSELTMEVVEEYEG